MRIHHQKMVTNAIIYFIHQYTKQMLNIIPNVTRKHYNAIQCGKKK